MQHCVLAAAHAVHLSGTSEQTTTLVDTAAGVAVPDFFTVGAVVGAAVGDGELPICSGATLLAQREPMGVIPSAYRRIAMVAGVSEKR